MIKRPFRRRRGRSGRSRLADLALAVALLGALTLVVGQELTPPGETVAGPARIVDGDTLVIGGARIRIEGIDAPELAQRCSSDGGEWPCGEQARDALASVARHKDVTCEGGRRDRYGRLVARCMAGDTDLGSWMAGQGWAVAYGGYFAEEAEARRAGRGLWAGSFETPQEWRRIHGGLVEEPHGGYLEWLSGPWRGLWRRLSPG